jgi:hypothetical protein
MHPVPLKRHLDSAGAGSIGQKQNGREKNIDWFDEIVIRRV